MDLGPHAGFIVITYGLAILIVGAMMAWVLIDHRRQLRSLAELEARGVTRRSPSPARAGVESGFPSAPKISPP
jgi:heme exporter protein D